VLEIGAPATGRSAPQRLWSWVLAHVRGRTRVVAVVLTTAVLLACAAAFVFAYRSSDDQDLAATRNQIRSLEQRERQDVVDANAADLDRLLATDFTLITPDGQLLSRDGYLLALASGDLDFRVFEPVSPIAIHTDGQQAVVNFSSRLDVSSGTRHLKHEAWHTHVWEKSHGRWQMVWSQTTAVGGFPPPTAGD
jgi:hypothetical protein